MKTSPSISAAPSGDWLVVIDRFEANVFRSTVSGFRSQCIRAHLHLPKGDAEMPSARKRYRNGQERADLHGFFEPLAGVLRGAHRILIFGRVTPLGDEAGPFVFWLYNRYPELAGRIVASVQIELDETSESDLLAKARAFYERTAIDLPQTAGSAARAPIDRKRGA